MVGPEAYPITAAELARREGFDGLQLRNVLRAHPELVPGHVHGSNYRIDREVDEAIMGHPEVRTLNRRRRK